MKKFLLFTLVAGIMSTAMFTGCGSSGKSNAEDAAKAYAIAYVEHDVDAMMSLIPNDVVKYLDEEYKLSEESIEKSIDLMMNRLDARLGDEIDDVRKKAKKAKVESQYEQDIDSVRRLSEEIGVSAESYIYIELDCEIDCYVYKYNDKWYPSGLIFDVMNESKIDY